MFFSKSRKIKELETQIAEMQGVMTPEMTDVLTLQNTIKQLKIDAANIEKENNNALEKAKLDLEKIQASKNTLTAEVDNLRKNIIECNEELLYQECSLYEPKFIFLNAEAYKTELNNIRNQQKGMIQDGTATTGNNAWSVNGSVVQGRKMVKDMQKLLLRAFNSECDILVNNVKCNNYDSYVKRMSKACETISKLGAIMSISISPKYHDLKLSELALALDYQQKKQLEKEEQREVKQRMREEAALRKEIEEARKKIIKEQAHYQQALDRINKQIAAVSPEEAQSLVEKQHELESQLSDITKKMADIDYREANQRAGYVYIISNIGAFGENVYKIGMTRRLEPMDRVTELGDASVPFKFDVHALIFSDDAPSLENALHKAFEDRKINMINTRREFFRVTLDEIKNVVKANFDKTVEFIDFPEAEEYRMSQKLYTT